MPTLVFAVLLAVAQASAPPAAASPQRPATPPPATAPAAPAPTTQRPVTPPAATPRPAPAAPRPMAFTVKVTDRSGKALAGAQVTLEGPSSRQGTTTADGSVTLQNVNAGAYRIRIEHDDYVTLEKETTTRAGTATVVEAALSAAPPPPVAPPPAAESTPSPQPELTAGDPALISIPDRADQLQSDKARSKDDLLEDSLGCSGNTASKLVLARRNGKISGSANPNADEMLYVIAGEGDLVLAGNKAQAVGPASFAVVPRGTQYSVTRRRGQFLLLLSVTSGGDPCPGAPAAGK